MSGTLVTVDHVSKKFCRSLKNSLWYGMKDLAGELLGRSRGHGDLRKDEFWAVKDVSFDLRRGQCLGLIGRNGAGKSTLLKMLNGLIKPDKGRIEMRGRVGALIELGAGFNPILTGRENVYVNAAVLGIEKPKVDEKLDAIIEFAEIDEFIDMSVQHYSSGMRVRLGFAIAAQLDPDVLIIDEVLAVGDVGFRAKCFNAIMKLMEKAAVIIVSHSMPAIARVCSHIVVLNMGVVEFQGKDVAKGIDTFYGLFESQKSMAFSGDRATIIEVDLESNGVVGAERIHYLDNLIVHIRAKVDSSIKRPNFLVNILGQELGMVTMCSSYFDGFVVKNSDEGIDLSIDLGEINLNPGTYFIEVGITADAHGEVLAKHQAAKRLQVLGKNFGSAPVLIAGTWRLNA
jgi:lipopolysaccharide transport system ATP-binding protein